MATGCSGCVEITATITANVAMEMCTGCLPGWTFDETDTSGSGGCLSDSLTTCGNLYRRHGSSGCVTEDECKLNIGENIYDNACECGDTF